jgi:hypothetical protein
MQVTAPLFKKVSLELGCPMLKLLLILRIYFKHLH